MNDSASPPAIRYMYSIFCHAIASVSKILFGRKSVDDPRRNGAWMLATFFNVRLMRLKLSRHPDFT